MANRSFTRSLYTLEEYPVVISCNFIVDNTNALGIRSLKGPGVKAVYMNTSATPATGNPNPAAGTILVQLQDNYTRLLSGGNQILSPNSGSDVKIDNSALTAGVAYTITTLGNATAAKWQAIGVPVGVTAAVGVSFIALTNGGTGNVLTSRVQAAASTGSGIASIEIVGSPNASIAPLKSTGQGYGANIIYQCHDYAGALAAPVAGSIVSLIIYLSNGSNTVQGE